jgi:hypothetical protein
VQRLGRASDALVGGAGLAASLFSRTAGFGDPVECHRKFATTAMRQTRGTMVKIFQGFYAIARR